MASRLCYGWGGCLLVINRLVADVAFLGEGMAWSWFLTCTALACFVVSVLLGWLCAAYCVTVSVILASGCRLAFCPCLLGVGL